MRTIEDLATYLKEVYVPLLAQISTGQHEVRLEERELLTLWVTSDEVPDDPNDYDFSRDDECLRHNVIYFLPKGLRLGTGGTSLRSCSRCTTRSTLPRPAGLRSS